MNSIKTVISAIDKRILFILFSLIYILLSIFINEILTSYELYHNLYSNQLSIDRINTLIKARKKFEWIGYLIVPVIMFTKIFLIALSIEIGVIFKGYKVSFKRIFHVVLVAESIPVLAQIVRTVSLHFLNYDTIDDIQNFYPLSILNLIGTNNINIWFVYPLQLINLFMIAHFLILAYGLSIVLEKKPLRMLSFTASTYGICLLIWVMFVMFINVNYL